MIYVLPKKIAICEVFDKGLGHFYFRRTLWGDILLQWNETKEGCANVSLNRNRGTLIWSLTKDVVYTVKSFYNQMILSDLNFPFKFWWKVKIPPKINVFIWFTVHNCIPTKDNHMKRGWTSKKNVCNVAKRSHQITFFYIALQLNSGVCYNELLI